jgi:tripartite-type tricarboxylate transporter receptor subunit TctC
MIQKAYYAFAIPSASPANDLKGFIAHAKANPGKLNYGRVGIGSVTEILPRQLEKLTGIKMTGVTFKGTGPALQEVVAGRIDFAVGPLLNTMPLYEGKKLKVIGLTSAERLPQYKQVPTLKEQGVDIVNYGWWGVCTGSGTPKPIVDLLNKHVVAAVASNEFRTGMTKANVIPTPSTTEEIAREVAATAKLYGTLIKELGIPQVD